MRHLTAVTFIPLLIGSLCASAQDVGKIKSDAANEAIAEHGRETRALEEAYKLKVKQLDDAYVARLRELRNTCTEKLQAIQKEVASDDLDEAVRIRDAAGRLTSLPLSPPSAKSAAKAGSASFSVSTSFGSLIHR